MALKVTLGEIIEKHAVRLGDDPIITDLKALNEQNAVKTWEDLTDEERYQKVTEYQAKEGIKDYTEAMRALKREMVENG